jgi:hypothetical protein
MSKKSNVIGTCFLVSILNYKPCHVPHKHRCPIKKSDYSKAHVIKIYCHLFGVGMIAKSSMMDLNTKNNNVSSYNLSPSSVET